jgi:Zn-dependent peptidase ImmA (M78 family)
MYMNPDPKAEARALLDRYWTGRPMPVDPAAIAHLMGVKVLRGKLPDDVAGVLLKKPGHDPRIVVQASDLENRRRFTVARELGRFVYLGATPAADESEYQYVDRRSTLAHIATDPGEQFANAFAAELLMPESVVKSARKQFGRALGALGATFGVPQERMSDRLRLLKR